MSYVQDPLITAAATEQGLDLEPEAVAELQRFVASVSASVPAAAGATAHIASGRSDAELLLVADRVTADIVVVGSHGMSGPTRWLFGSTTERLLHRADRTMIVVPDGWRAPKPESGDLRGLGPIIVAIDFSESAEVAARVSCELAAQLDTSLTLVHVVPELIALGVWRRHADTAVHARIIEARRRLDVFSGTLPAAVPRHTFVETGTVSNVLADLANQAEQESPLLVLGRALPNDFARPGSTCHRTFALAKVPVMMHVIQP